MFHALQNKDKKSSEFWLISIPNESSLDEAWDVLCKATQSSHSTYSYNYHFEIPFNLKVGTLDQLVGLSDDLQKTDEQSEKLCRKIVTSFETVLDRDKDLLAENLVVNNSQDPYTYITQFKWDTARFPTRLPLKTLESMITKRTSQIETDLKSKIVAFDKVNQEIQSEIKSTNNLLTRDLSNLVKPSDLILNSNSMETVLVCVNKGLYQQWKDNYETLTAMVVPRSSRLLAEDDTYGLYSVVIFKKVYDAFSYACRQKGGLVRGISSIATVKSVCLKQDLRIRKNNAIREIMIDTSRFYIRLHDLDIHSTEQKQEKLKNLESERSRLFGPLVRWLKVHFSEAFIDWIHVKAIRVFVESVLRYSLPVNFCSFILQPNIKTIKKLREILDKTFEHLGLMPLESGNIEEFEDYRSYVFLQFDIAFTQKF